MTALGSALLDALDDDALDALAAKLAPRLAHISSEPAPTWLTARQAATHIAAPVGRIHDLVQLGKLKPRRDGRRLLFRPAELDAYIEGRQQ
jgi:hypothetical protein